MHSFLCFVLILLGVNTFNVNDGIAYGAMASADEALTRGFLHEEDVEEGDDFDSEDEEFEDDFDEEEFEDEEFEGDEDAEVEDEEPDPATNEFSMTNKAPNDHQNELTSQDEQNNQSPSPSSSSSYIPPPSTSPPSSTSQKPDKKAALLQALQNADEEDKHDSVVAKFDQSSQANVTSILGLFKSGDVITIQFDDKTYLSRCERCFSTFWPTLDKPKYDIIDAAVVVSRPSGPLQSEYWRVEHVSGGNKIRLVGENGRYLRRVAESRQNKSSAFKTRVLIRRHLELWSLMNIRGAFQFVSVDGIGANQPGTVWTIVKEQGGGISLTSDDGWYLTCFEHASFTGVSFVGVSDMSAYNFISPKVVDQVPSAFSFRPFLDSGGIAPFVAGDYVVFKTAMTNKYKTLQWRAISREEPYLDAGSSDLSKQNDLTDLLLLGPEDLSYREIFRVESVGDLRAGKFRLQAINGKYVGLSSLLPTCANCTWTSIGAPYQAIYNETDPNTVFIADQTGTLKFAGLANGSYANKNLVLSRTKDFNGVAAWLHRTVFSYLTKGGLRTVDVPLNLRATVLLRKDYKRAKEDYDLHLKNMANLETGPVETSNHNATAGADFESIVRSASYRTLGVTSAYRRDGSLPHLRGDLRRTASNEPDRWPFANTYHITFDPASLPSGPFVGSFSNKYFSASLNMIRVLRRKTADNFLSPSAYPVSVYQNGTWIGTKFVISISASGDTKYGQTKAKWYDVTLSPYGMPGWYMGNCDGCEWHDRNDKYPIDPWEDPVRTVVMQANATDPAVQWRMVAVLS